ncbi:MAG: CHAT domain-containing protein, partial [Planctomycetota bacterium]|nr:CHAT domain-containing protein [Planctomycetota bacterium]
HCDREGFGVIVRTLFRREYRILHLAGHGVHDYVPAGGSKPVTGMVLGQGKFLTAVEIQQLPYCPELVFLNCCHLGRTGAGDTGAAPVEYNRLAANLALAFMRKGCKAVVAAGWAVDDDAAATFARTFYRGMVEQRNTFGDSVKEARSRTYASHPGTNTWGAYQCYGDHAYVLGGGAAAWKRRASHGYATPEQALIDVENLIQRARTEPDLEPLERQLDRVVGLYDAQRIPDAKGREAEFNALFGRAYRELDCFAEAIQRFEQALAAPDANFHLKDIEQLENTRVRRDFMRAVSGDQTLRKAATGIRRSIRALKALPARKDTMERLSLLGSAYKRLAYCEKPAENLVHSYGYYRQAHEHAPAGDAWPLTNSAALAIVIHARAGKRAVAKVLPIGEIRSEVQQARTALEQRDDSKFWASIWQVDLDVLGILVDALAGRDPNEHTERIAASYRAAVGRALPREFRSVREQFAWLVKMVPRHQKAMLTFLQSTRETLASLDRRAGE